MRGRDRNLGMGNAPARTLHAILQRRNVFDEWGVEMRGGFGDGESFMGEWNHPLFMIFMGEVFLHCQHK